MSHPRIKIPRVSDKALYDCFKFLAKKYSNYNLTGSAIGNVSLGAVDVNEKPVGILNNVLSKNDAIIESLSLNINGFIITFYRGGQVAHEAKSPIYDEVIFHEQQHNVSAEDRVDIISYISNKLKAFDPNRNISQGLDASATLEAIQISTLERLEKLNEDIICRNEEYRRKLEAEIEDKKKELNNKFIEQLTTLKQEHDEKHLELIEQKEELNRRIKEVDDRDNTHVRRELRTNLLTEISDRQKSFKLTKDTNKLRSPIHILCITTILVLWGASYFYGDNLYTAISTAKNPVPISIMSMLAIKSTTLTISAIGFTIFYLRWMNRWLDQHTQAEFQIKQFQLDVDRASWVVETALEWKREVKDVIPTVLLESITKNLFQADSKSTEVPLHPGDQLASALLGTASKVRVKAGDATLEFEGKKLKKQMADPKKADED